MSAPSDTLNCLLCPEDVDAASLDATLAVVASTLAIPPLEYRIDDTGGIHRIAGPGSWLIERIDAGEPALLCNGDEQQLVSIDISILQPRYVPRNGRLAEVWLRIPNRPELAKHAYPLIRLLGPAVRAYWGHISPVGVGGEILRRYAALSSTALPPGALVIGILTHVPHPAIPALIGWVNYWSAETCQLVDFSPTAPQSRVFQHVVACEGGGVALQLTAAPLDLENPEHIAALEAAYDAFPAIHRAAGSHVTT